MKEQLKKNYEDALKRLDRRYELGVISKEKYLADKDWERRNYESGNRLFAERLARALTPKNSWR